MIKDANLQLGSGLTVLTGETGAGKTALLGACKLLVGERADAQLVRAGADEARVEAVFEGQDGAEQIVIRRVNKDGRSRCSLNDSICTVGTLVENIGPLLDLYGQHDHQSLLKPIEQLRALDSFGGKPLLQALSVYRQAYAHYTASKTALER
jgi:DNA repair protein RecN (Recombination protein N)